MNITGVQDHDKPPGCAIRKRESLKTGKSGCCLQAKKGLSAGLRVVKLPDPNRNSCKPVQFLSIPGLKTATQGIRP